MYDKKKVYASGAIALSIMLSTGSIVVGLLSPFYFMAMIASVMEQSGVGWNIFVSLVSAPFLLISVLALIPYLIFRKKGKIETARGILYAAGLMDVFIITVAIIFAVFIL